MNTSDFAVLMISGFNMRAVIAMCRFCSSRSIPFHLAASNSSDPVYLTSYRNNVFLKRSSSVLDAADFCTWLTELKRRFGYKRVLIAPTSEFLNRFLLSNRDEIESSGGIIPLVERELYESISDKHPFSEMCRNSGIVTPQELGCPPDDFPFVAKPLRYATHDNRQLKPYLLLDRDDWRDFLLNERPNDFYYQEFVSGASLYLLAYISRAGKVTQYSQENLVQQAQGGSIILAKRSTFHLGDESKKYISMLMAHGFFGLVMIEVRLNRQTGESVMIEANPRMWGPIQFTLDNDIDLLGALIGDFAANIDFDPAPPGRMSDYYFWSGGLSDSGKPFAYHNYSPEKFLDEYKKIASCDIFLREDTLGLYEKELES